MSRFWMAPCSIQNTPYITPPSSPEHIPTPHRVRRIISHGFLWNDWSRPQLLVVKHRERVSDASTEMALDNYLYPLPPH